MPVTVSGAVAPLDTRSHYLTMLTPPRYLAALAVVYLHWFVLAYPGRTAPGFEAGHLAVSFFFVLSGHVLSHVYCADSAPLRPNLRRFAVARLARIYPAYMLGLLLTLPWYLSDLQRLATRQGIAAAIVQPFTVLTLTQTWVPGWALAWNFPAWSLSVEAFFYATFLLYGPRVARWRGVNAWTGLAATCLVGGIVLPLLARRMSVTTGEWFDYGGFSRLPAFIAGIFSYAVLQSEGVHRSLRGSSLVIFGTVLLLAEIFVFRVAEFLESFSRRYVFPSSSSSSQASRPSPPLDSRHVHCAGD